VTPAYRGGVVLAEVVRSGFVEGRHHGSFAALDSGGSLVSSAGDPNGAIFPRSSNKPMQAAAMLRSGLRLPDPADLALVAASHRGEPFHIERVRAMLALGGLTENDLRCPGDLPIHEPSRHELVRAGIAPARVYMNCSGKHTGMLLTCITAGWSIVDYIDPDHPLQKGCRTAIEDLAGETVSAVGVDGCGAPVMAISLVGLARAFLNCVSAQSGTPERTVADAMRAYPEMMSGTDVDDAMLMRGVPGLLSKGGAEGVVAVAIPGTGAVALKIDDGAMRARMPVLVGALRRLGVESSVLDELQETPVLGGGVPVGSVRMVWDESR
jgi:L-asparaginase II